MLVEQNTYIPPFGVWCEVCMYLPPHTCIPPFGGCCEVCLLGTYIHTYLRLGRFGAGVRYVKYVCKETYIHTSVWGLVSGMYVPLLGSLCLRRMEQFPKAEGHFFKPLILR